MRTFKLCLLGESGVGKTSIVARYVFDQFKESILSTLGAAVLKYETRVKHPTTGLDEEIKLMIWDIMGAATIRELLREAYFREASGLLAVCDVTRPGTATALTEWVESARKVAGRLPQTIVANKIDLPSAVADEELENLAVALHAPLLFTSAKTGEGVDDAFENLARRILAATE